MTAAEGAAHYCAILADIQRWVESMSADNEHVDFIELPRALVRLREQAYIDGRNAKSEELRQKLGLNEGIRDKL